MIYYVCKYTPIELFAGFQEECMPLNEMPEHFEQADQVAHANLCGFGRAVIQAVLENKAEELVLVNCCDTMRRVFDILKKTNCCSFLYLLDLPHENGECQKKVFAGKLKKFRDEYSEYKGKIFQKKAFCSAFRSVERKAEPYIGMLGVRIGPGLEKLVQDTISMPVRNLTCLGNRDLIFDREAMLNAKEEEMFLQYAEAILSQVPCCRMNENTRRSSLFLDENLKGILYHTIKFCDYYGFEYAEIKNEVSVPLLKLETDYTSQSIGQLQTRVEAFAEAVGVTGKRTEYRKDEVERIGMLKSSGKYYAAGIDSGSTSTDVVILSQDEKIVSSIIIPTGGGAGASAEMSLDQALEKAGIEREQIVRIVTTGYGRAYIESGDESITEITCHAKGAHFLNPEVRTIIDIGGQDSKAIRIDESGAVQNFLMNDKCAAGTGRFLEMMARTLGITLEEISTLGLDWKENITISSMCTVFAESEVVSLVAQNKSLPDIIHGLNCSVAAKVGALAGRLGNEGEYMMTGGVARNRGIVTALEEKLGVSLFICEEAQLCGALGAALSALEELKKE